MAAYNSKYLTLMKGAWNLRKIWRLSWQHTRGYTWTSSKKQSNRRTHLSSRRLTTPPSSFIPLFDDRNKFQTQHCRRSSKCQHKYFSCL